MNVNGTLEIAKHIQRLEEELKLSNKKERVLKAENARLYKCIDEITVERLKMAQYIEFLTLDNAKHIQDKQELLEEIEELQHMLDPRNKKMKQGADASEIPPGQMSLDEIMEETRSKELVKAAEEIFNIFFGGLGK